MPVSSYVLRCRREDQERVLGALISVGDFDVGARSLDGMAIATATEDHESAEAVGRALKEVPGVLDAILVYYSVEDLMETNREAVVA